VGQVDVSENLNLASRQLSGESCRSFRARLGWSPEQLAGAAGIATLTVLSLERGERRPREGTLIAIRRALRKGLMRAHDLSFASAATSAERACCAS
jgi:transcriptional regulator with XRE-family HTH domain